MKGEISKYIGKRIRYFRKKKGLTQKELGNKVGVKHNTISSYEKGTNDVEHDMLFKMSMILDVPINDFFPYINKEDNNKDSMTKYNYYPVSISAGLPLNIDGITNDDVEQISIPDSVMKNHAGSKDVFFMKTNGESMNNVIPHDSLIAVKHTDINNLKNGDIVVYSNDYEYSVKHYYKDGNKLIFKPNSTNPIHHDQTYNIDDNITIHGKVVLYIVNLD